MVRPGAAAPQARAPQHDATVLQPRVAQATPDQLMLGATPNKNRCAMKLSELLKKENNNLDVFRLVAACMVIYGHAYAVVPQAGYVDVVARLLGHDYSGSLAVKIFFFLSGLVVTNSLLHKRDVLHFAIARFFRIWPALVLVTVASALLLGPLVSALSLGDYFSQGGTYRYVLDNLLLKTNYSLPGVFVANPDKAVVNGSLWTLPHEVGAYIALLAVFMVGVFRLPVLALAIFLLLLADPLTGNRLLFTWRTPLSEVDLLAPCFALGALLALYKERIEVGLASVSGLVLLYLLFRSSAYSFYFFYAALFTTILYLSGLAAVRRFKPRSDLSYGVYLWGFPVQQTLQWMLPQQGTHFNQVVSLGVTLVLGFASWHLVEKRGIAMGQSVIGRLSARQTRHENEANEGARRSAAPLA